MESINTKVDQKRTKQVVVDAGWHKILKQLATEQETTIKSLVEGIFADALSTKVIHKGTSGV